MELRGPMTMALRLWQMTLSLLLQSNNEDVFYKLITFIPRNQRRWHHFRGRKCIQIPTYNSCWDKWVTAEQTSKNPIHLKEAAGKDLISVDGRGETARRPLLLCPRWIQPQYIWAARLFYQAINKKKTTTSLPAPFSCYCSVPRKLCRLFLTRIDDLKSSLGGDCCF